MNILRSRLKGPSDIADQPSEISETSNTAIPTPDQHVNFFNDLEQGKIVSTKTNVEHEKEKKEQQEKYEKQIGYLTYLGQDTNEALKKRDWYDVLPERKDQVDESGNKIEVGLKMKRFNDPLLVMERYLGKSLKSSKSLEKNGEPEGSNSVKKLKKYESILGPSIKISKKRKRSPEDEERSHKKQKKSKKSKNKKEKKKHKKKKTKKIQSSTSSLSSESEDEVKRQLEKEKLVKLRAERLEREKIERLKADKLLGLVKEDEPPKKKEVEKPVVRQKYNSQFNPEIARQNLD